MRKRVITAAVGVVGLVVIAILVLAPNGLVAIRGGAVKRAWRRLRPQPVTEGAKP